MTLLHARAAAFCRHAVAFPIAMVALYALIAGIGIAKGRFDVSSLIVAGDRYVDRATVPTPIAVRTQSSGYDGQFYFRLANQPLPRTVTGSGVTFDRPAYRSQRIGYPLIVFGLSLGRPALVPVMMVLANLLGIFVMARSAVTLRATFAWPGWFAPAVMAWPGLTATLLHDTTEIVAAAWLMLAICAAAERRPARFMASGVMTLLTRETAAVVFACAALFGGRPTVRRLAIGLFPVIAYAAWRLFLARWWNGIGGTGQSFNGDMGWPMLGFLQTVHDCVMLHRPLSPRPGPNAIRNIYVVITACAIFATGVWTAWHVPGALRAGGPRRSIAAGWIGLAIVMSMLTAQGPWIDQNGYFRAFTEFWLMSLLVLAGAGLRLPKTAAALAIPAWIASVCFLF